MGALLSTYAGALRPTSYAAQVQAAPGCPVGSTPAANDAELQARVLESTDDSTICVTESFALSATLQLDDTSLTLVGRDDSDVTLIAPSGSRHISAYFAPPVTSGLLTLERLSLVGGRGNNGGAVFAQYGNVVVTHAVFADDSSAWDGGAIFLRKGSVTITDSRFEDTYSGIHGGAIYVVDGDVTVTRGYFSRTTSQNNLGGAIHTASSVSRISLTDSTFIATSAAQGGAIDANGSVYVTGGRFENSRTTSRGGAIYADDTVSVDGVSFANVRTVGVNSPGGAIGSDGAVVVRETTFTDVSATGSGGAIDADGAITIEGSQFTGIRSGGRGGGAVNNDESSVTVLDSSFTDTETSGGGGGAIYGDEFVSTTNTTFTDTRAPAASGKGGAIAIDAFPSGSLTVTNGSFTRSFAGRRGGAIAGGFYSTVHIADSAFVDDSAVQGGAVFVRNSLQIVNATFVGNSADDSGGAIYSEGGAPYTLDLDFVTITGNSGSSGGGVYAQSGVAVSITNSIIAGNTASSTGADVALAGSATLDDSFNIFTSASSVSGATVTGGTNIFGDPRLNPLADNGGPTPTMLPKTDSPVYLAGDPNWTAPPAFDQRGTGFPRNAGGRVNMGAIQGRTPPPPPIPTFPPGPPQDLTAETEDRVVTVSWLPPSSSGSFPVSTYQVDDSTGTHSCLVTVRPGAELRCTFDDVVGGQVYEFRVRALNGAGWGAWSPWSNPVTPVTSKIVITGTRAGREVKVLGVTTGLVGATVTPRLRFPGPHPYRDGLTRPIVDASGDFTWQRQTRKKVYVYFLAEDVRSNRVIIKPQ